MLAAFIFFWKRERRGLFHTPAAKTNDSITGARTAGVNPRQVRHFAEHFEALLQEHLPST
jgi:hypothetical protein